MNSRLTVPITCPTPFCCMYSRFLRPPYTLEIYLYNIYVRCINNKFLVLVSLVLFSAVGFRFPFWLLGPANINNPTPNTPRWRRHSRKSEANVEAKANRNRDRNRNRNRNQNSCGKDKLEIGSTVYSHANKAHTHTQSAMYNKQHKNTCVCVCVSDCRQVHVFHWGLALPLSVSVSHEKRQQRC